MALPPNTLATATLPVTLPPTLSYEEFTKRVDNLHTIDDVHNFLRDLVAPTLSTDQSSLTLTALAFHLVMAASAAPG